MIFAFGWPKFSIFAILGTFFLSTRYPNYGRQATDSTNWLPTRSGSNRERHFEPTWLQVVHPRDSRLMAKTEKIDRKTSHNIITAGGHSTLMRKIQTAGRTHFISKIMDKVKLSSSTSLKKANTRALRGLVRKAPRMRAQGRGAPLRRQGIFGVHMGSLAAR